jgi:hypothetical protein
MHVFGHIAAKPDFLPAHGQNLGWHPCAQKFDSAATDQIWAVLAASWLMAARRQKFPSHGRPMAVSDERQQIRD